MRKNKLLLLLALLITAATGAWADEVTFSVAELKNSLPSGNTNLDIPYDWTVSSQQPKVTIARQDDLDGMVSVSTVLPLGKDHKITVSAPTGGSIDGVTFTTNPANQAQNISASTGSCSKKGVWSPGEGDVNSVTFTPTNNFRITDIVVVYSPAASAPSAVAKHLITATYREQTRLLEQPLPYATTIGELFEAVTGEPFSNLISTMSSMEMPLTGISSNNTSAVSIGELNGASTPVTVNADGKATISINFGSYAYGIFVSVTSPLYAYMKDGVKDADKWTVKVGDGQAQALPIGGLKGDGSETVTLQYNGRLKVKGVKATSDAAPAAPTGNIVDLSTLEDDYVAQDGDVLTGETTSYIVNIAAGATVTLDGVNISSGSYCIKCLGDATIILKDGTTNTLTSTSDEYPALSIGDANTTLTIQGSTGVLNVTSGENCAGIGGGYANTNHACGNITIEGGVITAQGGNSGAGIGSDCGEATCGDIIITGGTITAKGGSNAAGIGTGSGYSYPVVCGAITIANTVTKVTATKGTNPPHSIGKGFGSKATCGTVTIGGTKYWENNAAVNGGDTYLAQSPLTYDPTAPAKTPATVTTAPTGAAIVGVGKNTALVSGGVADGGSLMYAVTTTNTKPASTDGFSDAVPTAQTITASGKVYVWYYVKADDTHSDSEIAATAIEVPVADIVWDATNISDLYIYGTGESYTKEGITLSCNAGEVKAQWYNFGDPKCMEFYMSESGGYTFTAPTGKAFTKIEMKPVGPSGWQGAYTDANLGTGWAFVTDYVKHTHTITWKGNAAASTVGLLTGADEFQGDYILYIAFYLSE